MDEHPPEHPQPGAPADGGDSPPAQGPAPWAFDPKELPDPPAPNYPPDQPFPPAPNYPPQPYPPAPNYPQAQPFPPAQNYPPAQPYPAAPNYLPPYQQTGPYPGPVDAPLPLTAPPVPAAPEPWVERGDVRAACLLAGVLVVVGILAGVLWSVISPHAQGVVVSKTEIIPFEQENWIAADGRFAIITAVIGLVVGSAAWLWRSQRGPVLVVGLAIGAGLGALLTALVGYWLSSGHDSGAVNTQIRLRVHVHAHGLIALEAVLALAAYLVGVLFSGPDDLGRPSMIPNPEPVVAGTIGPAESGRPEVGTSSVGFGGGLSGEGRSGEGR